MNAFRFAAAATIALLATAAHAAGNASIMPARIGLDANTNTTIIGHPASPRWRVVHAGAEHPAVIAARVGQHGVDANTFTVQPPASVTWLPSGDADSAVVAAANSAAAGTQR